MSEVWEWIKCVGMAVGVVLGLLVIFGGYIYCAFTVENPWIFGVIVATPCLTPAVIVIAHDIKKSREGR